MSQIITEPTHINSDIDPTTERDHDSCFEDSSAEDAPTDFDLESTIKALDEARRPKQSPGIKMPDGPYISIAKSEMLNIVNISDMVLDSKILSGNGKFNFIEISVENSDMVSVRFRNQQNYITIKVAVTSKGMDTERIVFFKGDLKTYVIYCQEESFIIQKDVEKNKFMVNLFDKYVYVKTGTDWASEKSKLAFSDQSKYKNDCSADATLIRKVLRPLARVTDKKSKTEKINHLNRVSFYKNHAVIMCDDSSLLVQPFPNNVKFPDCAVGGSFINVLSALLRDDYKGQIEISLSPENRIKIASADFEVTGAIFSSFGNEIEDKNLTVLRPPQDENYVEVDCELLRRMVSYSCNMRLSKKMLAFDYGSDGQVKCVILHEDDSKDFNYIVYLSADKQSFSQPLEKSAIVLSQPLRRLLKAYEWGKDETHDSKLRIVIQNSQVVLKCNNIYVILKNLNVTFNFS